MGDTLNVEATRAILALVSARMDENWFGLAFPSECQDGGSNIGSNEQKLKHAFAGYRIIWPRDWPDQEDEVPDDPQLFDLLEFSYEHIALPIEGGFHSYWRHSHFSYDQDEGRARFASDINRIFERQGLAFELKDGEILRLAPTGLHEALSASIFQTSDADLDRLLETARDKFLNKSAHVRVEGLEKLWDAWERLKTLESGADKRAQVSVLLDKATAVPGLRDRLEAEARELTFIGNNFMIRHTEVGKPAISETAQVDYLFHRMFAMVRMLLKTSGRGG